MSLVNSEPEQKILIIVEGECKEVKLLEKLSKLYLSANKSIVPYGTNIYDLYNVLVDYFGESFEKEESFDLLLALRERESRRSNNTERIKILEDKYSDILLVFDFERQDTNFTEEKIKKMMCFFNDSIDKGRLYLNYPMVEAFNHLQQSAVKNCCCDTNFCNCSFTEDDICGHNYKSRVSSEGCDLDINRLNREQMDNLISHHSCKANYIIKGDYSPCEDYSQHNMLVLLEKQLADYNQNKAAYVISTCAFFIPEMYPHKITIRNFSN